MSVVFMESFDNQLAGSVKNGWVAAGGGGASYITGLLGSGTAYRINSNSTPGQLANTATPWSAITTGWAHFRYRTTFGGSGAFCLLYTPATSLVLQVTISSGKFAILNGSSSVLVTGTTTVVANVAYHIGIGWFTNGASGTVTLYVNGIQEATATVNIGSTGIGAILLWGANGNTNAEFRDFDDVVVNNNSGSWNNTFLGDVKVIIKSATSEGSNTAFTLGAGSTKTAAINEVAGDGDTSYVYSTNAGDRQTYNFAALPSNVGQAFALQVCNYIRKDDAGTRQMAAVIRLGGVNYDGTTSAGLSPSYYDQVQVYDADPTGAQWTNANVDAAEYGVKVVT